MVRTYQHAEAYLNSFINYEKKPFFPYKKSLKLERMHLLLEHLKVDFKNIKAIHIAGTKGKGSTAEFCASLLAARGYRVGLYTSPHFFDFRERIVIIEASGTNADRRVHAGKHFITRAQVLQIVKTIKPVIDTMIAERKDGRVSFFELYTAIAFIYFLKMKTDFVVLETGLGGRLDATNVIHPLVSVITRIDYDHTDKLGKKISQIAYEKAGIIKQNIPVVAAAQKTAALHVIEKKCRGVHAPLFIAGKDLKTTHVKISPNVTRFDFHFNGMTVKNAAISLKGKYQVENAALALAAVALLPKQAKRNEMICYREGLKNAYLPGRFEAVKQEPLIILDIAHNPVSFQALREALAVYYPHREIILIFACSQDKDAKGMLAQISYKKLILTRFHNPRAFAPEDIKKITGKKDACIASNIKEALRCADAMYNRNSLIVISGSFFLVSEAKEIVQPVKKKI